MYSKINGRNLPNAHVSKMRFAKNRISKTKLHKGPYIQYNINDEVWQVKSQSEAFRESSPHWNLMRVPKNERVLSFGHIIMQASKGSIRVGAAGEATISTHHTHTLASSHRRCFARDFAVGIINIEHIYSYKREWVQNFCHTSKSVSRAEKGIAPLVAR